MATPRKRKEPLPGYKLLKPTSISRSIRVDIDLPDEPNAWQVNRETEHVTNAANTLKRNLREMYAGAEPVVTID